MGGSGCLCKPNKFSPRILKHRHKDGYSALCNTSSQCAWAWVSVYAYASLYNPQVKEALSHYRLHIFETHKEHFTVVVGGACPLPGCVLGADKNPTIHFHCAYCSFTSTEVRGSGGGEGWKGVCVGYVRLLIVRWCFM